jgi:hypothetical protein
MKPAKSSTVKKSNDLVDFSVTTVVNYGIDRITDWTHVELLALQKKSKVPVCIQLKNGDYLVATYRINKVSSVCWEVNNLEFIDKRSAIFYCGLLHLNKYDDAKQLYKIDAEVGRLDLEKSLFRVRLDTAHMAKDQFKVDLYSSRFDNVKNRLKIAKKDLENAISYAEMIIRRLER